MLAANTDNQDDFSSIISDCFGPQAISAAIADVARQALAEAASVNAAALGAPAPCQTFVDGRLSADLGSVKPNGVIVGIFDLRTEMFAWIEDQLIAHSPVRTGRYQKSHRAFVDGVQVGIADIPADAKQVVFAPLSSYAPEIEPHDGKPGESRKAPDGVYQAVAALARQRFGGVADISFTYLPIPGVEQPQEGSAPAAEPAIVVDL